MPHVGEYIKHLRLIQQPKAWSLEVLSEKCGISVSFLSDVQRGISTPSLEGIEKIAAAFGLGAGDLLVKAGYTVNPALAWKCEAKVICNEGIWTVIPL